MKGDSAKKDVWERTNKTSHFQVKVWERTQKLTIVSNYTIMLRCYVRDSLHVFIYWTSGATHRNLSKKRHLQVRLL